jgi:hypothetical protein
MNEHLIEALRRLRRSSTETKSSVDGRLVTNVLLQFLTTPRTDTKRFEMLSLLGSILSWGEEEKEKAGLQRMGSHSQVFNHQGAGKSPVWGGGGGKSPELEKTDETEVSFEGLELWLSAYSVAQSFSRLWVEFLMKEANAGDIIPQAPALTSSSSTSSLPNSPKMGTLPPTLKAPQSRRLASIGSTIGMASTPELVSEKGKERAIE